MVQILNGFKITNSYNFKAKIRRIIITNIEHLEYAQHIMFNEVKVVWHYSISKCRQTSQEK